MDALSPEDRINAAGGETERIIKLQKIHVLTPRQCVDAPPREPVWKGIIARGDHVCLVSLPGGGKSAFAPYLGYNITLGRDVFGRRTKATPVLYIAAEDGAGMTQRIRALYEQLGDAPNFYLQPTPVDFLNQETNDAAEIEALIRRIRPGLVILDTIARSFPGLDENGSDQMGLVVRVARQFTMICNSAVMTLHHPPKEGVMSPRGHGVLNGDLDVSLYLAGEREQPRTITMGKNRNGPSDLAFTFTVVSHHLGTDADGDPITAPIAEPSNRDPKEAAAAAKESRLKDKPAIVLRELRSSIEQSGETVCPGEGFPTVVALRRQTLRQRLIERGWFPDHMLCTALDKTGKLERIGYATENTALTTLKRNAFVCFNRDWIWLL